MTQHSETTANKPKLTFYPSRFFMRNAKSPDEPTRVNVVFVDGRERNQLRHEYRVKTTEEQFRNLTSADLDTCPLRQRWGKKYRWAITPYTVVDCSRYERTVNGVATILQFELRLYMSERAQDDILNLRREQNLPIQNHKFESVRGSDCKSSIGNELIPLAEVDPAKMFPHVVYSGRKLSEWYDDAEQDKFQMAHLQKILAVRVLPNGKLDRSFVPAFNYPHVMAPPTAAQLEKWDAILPPPAEDAPRIPPSPAPSTAPAQGFKYDEFESDAIPF